VNFLITYSKNSGGGLFKRICRLIDALADAGHTVHYVSIGNFSLRHSNSENIVFHKIPKFTDVNSPFRFIHYALSGMLLTFYCIYLSKKYKIDSAIAPGISCAYVYGPAKYLFNIKIISFILGDATNDMFLKKMNKLLIVLCSRLEHIGFLITNKVITNNKYLTNNKCIIYKVKSAIIKYIPNDINTSKYKPKNTKSRIRREYNIPQEAFVYGYFGNLIEGKKVDLIIEAFQILNRKDVWLLIAGRGYYEKRLIELAEECSLRDNIIFAGWKNNVEDYINAVNMTVLPSLSEGMPESILESLGCGIPCIGSDISGIREVLYYDDLLFTPNNTSELSKYMFKIIEDKQHYLYLNNLCNIRKECFVFDWNKNIVDELTTRYNN